MWTIHKYHTFQYSIVRYQSGHTEEGGRSNCWQSYMWSNSQNDTTRKILQAGSGFHVCRWREWKRCCKLLKNSWSAIVNIDTISTLVHRWWGSSSGLQSRQSVVCCRWVDVKFWSEIFWIQKLMTLDSRFSCMGHQWVDILLNHNFSSNQIFNVYSISGCGAGIPSVYTNIAYYMVNMYTFCSDITFFIFNFPLILSAHSLGFRARPERPIDGIYYEVFKMICIPYCWRI